MVPIEIKIPKEIRNYHENIFFGLNTRQFVCSLLALGAAVGLYFCLRPIVGAEQVGWMCILGAAPFAACGFIRYHGMTAEQLLWAWIKSEILMLLTEFVPYMKLHCNLSRLEQEAQTRLASGDTLTPEETAYYGALENYANASVWSQQGRCQQVCAAGRAAVRDCSKDQGNSHVAMQS